MVELSLTVAPDWRGRGAGGAIVAALMAEARRWKPGARMIAHVKAFNTPSLRAFLRAGFAVKGSRCLNLELDDAGG
jgi:L-amino acid N-acyltransferase YncA